MKGSNTGTVVRTHAVERYRRTATLMCLLGAFVCLPGSGASGNGWGRDLVTIGGDIVPGVPLTIGVISGGAHISAGGWYCFVQGKNTVTLHGKKADDGKFHPVVVYEVGVEDETKWKKLGSNSEGPGSDTVTVSPDNQMVRVTIDMEPFRPWIGTYRYGRVVLENGDAAIIALEDLLPTADARDAAGNFKEDVGGGRAMLRHGFKLPQPNHPAVLSNVISLGDKLIGEFIVDARSEKPVTLKGSRNLDGDFWPTVTLEAGNSEKDWHEIGKSYDGGVSATLEIHHGKAEKIRVQLSDYKPVIDKFKFGKITFSDNESTVFYLDLLDPKG
jgi:hypothetical protein